SPKYTPYLDNCIGAHIQVVVPNTTAVQHRNRRKEKSQNVLCICDFDMRFIFVLAGWPGSVHDMRVFSDAQNRFGHGFPWPPEEMFYLLDSRYLNRPSYLAPYKRVTYHFQ
uniref:DDE Tnp4 domain-containing protein n=1 Tax=Oryza brachyantha TaxID=4533 RepID=J3N3S5_ORYBR